MKTSDLLKHNWKWVIATLIYIPIGYAQYKSMQADVETNKRRLQTYITINKTQVRTIHNLEVRIVRLETLIRCKYGDGEIR